MKAKVFNIKGEEVSTITLADEVFGQEYNEALIHQVVVAHLNNARQGTKGTLTRTEVRGHHKKPWRQKHTGRARQGSTKGPQWRGGGIVFAPKERDFSQKVNKEAKKVAFKSAISTKLANKEIVIIDDLKLAEGKTKEIKAICDNLKLDKTVLFVTDKKDDAAIRATGNIQRTDVETARLLDVYSVVVANKLVLTQAAAKSIEEAYKG